MNILVTGGTGFIGSNLLDKLLKKKYNVVLLKRKTSNTWRIRHITNKIRMYDIDLSTDYDAIIKKEKTKVIIHLAGKYIKQHKSREELKELIDSNITFPSLLLDSAVRNDVKIFVNTGTFFEYELKGKIDENSLRKPYDYYAVTKMAFETILKFYSANSNMKTATLKLFSPYGEKDNEKVIPLIIKCFLKRQPLFLTKGNQKLSFTYVDDIIVAYLKALDYLNNIKAPYYANFNIGSNKSVSIKEIVSLVRQLCKQNDMVNFGAVNNPKDEGLNITCDSSLAQSLLKWRAQYSIKSGLKKTIKYYKNELLNKA
ncbi:NAD(P)-dependent oxidoreductase [Candidatus Roizmanbacteria bacterium]|nr:NAD(P)-dependent oxidoreductase [Candidatus Roizmanbacteria bacterium]